MTIQYGHFAAKYERDYRDKTNEDAKRGHTFTYPTFLCKDCGKAKGLLGHKRTKRGRICKECAAED